jgi:SAM-dependent methyltransferase
LFLCSMAALEAGQSVLDVACGAGWFEKHAVERGCSRVVGIERSDALADKVRREVPGAEVVLMDATEGLSGLGRFSKVCAFDFLEHLPRCGEVPFLREAAAALEPGGSLLLSVPYRSLLSCVLDPAFYFGHRHYDLPGLEMLLSAAGLRVKRAAYAGGLWEQLSLIWLYVFKWVFRREMPFADFLEGRRREEYEHWSERPGWRAFSTMFVEAGARQSFC